MTIPSSTAQTEWTAVHLGDEGHPFASVIHNSEWVIVTGVGGHIPGTEHIEPTAREQTQQALRTISSLLVRSGSSMDEVVQIRPYVTDRRHAADMDEVLREHLPRPRPASGALVICQLIDERMCVELEVLAARGAKRVVGSVERD